MSKKSTLRDFSCGKVCFINDYSYHLLMIISISGKNKDNQKEVCQNGS